MRNNPRRSASGFTLLEVLIAVTLLAIMLGLLMSTFRIAGISWDEGEKRAHSASQLMIVADFLRRHLSGALPLYENKPSGEPTFSFSGTFNSLSYVSFLPEQVGHGALYRFGLFVDRADDKYALKLSLKPHASAGERDLPSNIEDVALLDDLESFEVSYLAPTTNTAPRFGQAFGISPPTDPGRGESPAWVDEWNRPAMPLLIRLDIQVRNEKRNPPLIVAPRIQVNSP
jgi:general secretion pathway protein J